MKSNPVAWFEIPVTNIERAKKFYEALFQIEINLVDFGGTQMGFFPRVDGASGAPGSLMQHESYTPSHKGALIYFASENLQTELDRLEQAGGKQLMPKTQISPENGYMGLFEDTEGNRIALHSNQ